MSPLESVALHSLYPELLDGLVIFQRKNEVTAVWVIFVWRIRETTHITLRRHNVKDKESYTEVHCASGHRGPRKCQPPRYYGLGLGQVTEKKQSRHWDQYWARCNSRYNKNCWEQQVEIVSDKNQVRGYKILMNIKYSKKILNYVKET